MILTTANHFLKIQQANARISINTLTKFLSGWAAKGRPQILEFQFDQSTQLALILANPKSFRFYGPNANAITVNSMLAGWKGIIKDFGVRTLCSPDTVMRKQLHDVEQVLMRLGAPPAIMMVFFELRFRFENHIRVTEREAQAEEQLLFGVERRWMPRLSDAEVKGINPFDYD